MLADGQLSYAPTGSDAQHASDRLYEPILEQAHRVLPAVSLWLGRADDAAAGDDRPVPRQRLAMPAILRVGVTAGYEDGPAHRRTATRQRGCARVDRRRDHPDESVLERHR